MKHSSRGLSAHPGRARPFSPVLRQKLASAPYRSRIGFQGSYETLPRWQTVQYVWRSLSEIQPDVVIISGWCGFGEWAAKLWCNLHCRLHILWAESNYFDRPRVFWKELMKRTFIRSFAAAHVCGTANAEYLVKLGFDARKIWTKYSPADTGLFRLVEDIYPEHNSRKVILFVGRLAPEKNIEFVFEALRLVSIEARQGLLLRIMGYGPLEKSLRSKAESLGLGGMIEFAGFRSKHCEVADVYHSADVLLLPSTSEPWGLTVTEGMLCGLPAIVSDRCGCARDLVKPGTGWAFNPSDQIGFARVLEKIAAMPLDDLRTMGRNAAALARGYSPENCANAVIDCISAVVLSPGETR